MRELRSCDFCGGAAAGTFEIVPPELEPTEAEQRRVVLCGECKARLEALLEPLLARAGLDVGAGATAASQGTSDAAGSSSRSERTSDSVPGSGDDIDRPGAESGTESGSGIATTTETGTETGTPTGITVEPGDATTVDPDDQVSHNTSDTTSERDRRRAGELEMDAVESETDADSDGETDGEGEDQDGSEDVRTATPSSDTDTETAASTAGSSEGRSDRSSGDRTRTQSPSESESDSRSESRANSPSHSPPAAETEGPPRAYSKVVRLLRNREFPMDRSAVESLAAGAYELENHEVEAVVDHAIERGEFRADGDQLHRP